MNVAASEFLWSDKYDLEVKSPDDYSKYIMPDLRADMYVLHLENPVVSIEEPFDQDD